MVESNAESKVQERWREVVDRLIEEGTKGQVGNRGRRMKEEGLVEADCESDLAG